MENQTTLEKKVALRKDILGKLIRGNLILAGTKVGTMLVPTLSVLGFIVPQGYITIFLLFILSSFAFAKNKIDEEKKEKK